MPAARGPSRPTWSPARAAASRPKRGAWPIAIPGKFAAIIERIEAVTLDYLSGQIEAGAEARAIVRQLGGKPCAGAVRALGDRADRAAGRARSRRAIRDVPVIGFPKGAGGKLAAYARETGVDAIGLDETVDPAWAAKELPDGLPVQGNLDPLALIAGGEPLEAAVARILDAFADRPHIFNLGHGILQDTPIAHVEQLIAAGEGGRVTDSDRLARARLSVGEGGARHLRDLLDGRAVPAAALLRLSPGDRVGSPEDRAWIEREARVRSIILTPAMLLVWILGLMLAFNLDLWGEHWFRPSSRWWSRLTGYQGWLGGYGKKLAAGRAAAVGQRCG